MCCKCPPFSTIVAYLFLSILLSIYFKNTNTQNFDTVLIRPCPDFPNDTMLISLTTEKINESIQVVNGNISIDFGCDKSTGISVLGFNGITTETVLKYRIVCELVGEILVEPQVTICPLPSGFYQITDVKMLTFDQITSKLLKNYKKFHMEIVQDDRMMACREFEIIKSNEIDAA